MKRRKMLLASVLCVLVVGVSGCGNAIPELTESQEQAITDYAVDIVLKYDVNYQSRLVELSEEDLAESEEAVVTPGPAPEESVGMDPVEKVPEVSVGEAVTANLSVEEVLGWTDICKLNYKEFQIADSFETDSAEQGYVSVEAAEGNKLLVAGFTLENVSSQEQHINMIANDAKFSLNVGNGSVKRCQVTLLENDLSTYFGDVPANGSADVVLIVEMAEELLQDVASLTLNVENGEKIATIPLF